MSKEAIKIKAEEVKEVSSKFTESASSIVVDLRGMTVAQNTDLRNSLREEGVSLRVIKNSILKRAAEDANFNELESVFSGPSAVAFSQDDSIAPSRIIKKFADQIEPLEIKGGIIDGNVVSVEEINKFASIPSKEVLLSQFMAEMQFPIRSFMYAVKAVAETKEEDSNPSPVVEEQINEAQSEATLAKGETDSSDNV